jgi:hypothetical protein
MKKPNIYPDRSQELLTLFEQAENNKKVMYVPIDYAKKDHLVMFCNGYGDMLRKPFSVENSVDGVKYLLDQVSRSCRHRHIQPEHVFLVEKTSTHMPKVLPTHFGPMGGWWPTSMPTTQKKQRGILQASTDRIDLTGIATMHLKSVVAGVQPWSET